jgi:hypothetical protein
MLARLQNMGRANLSTKQAWLAIRLEEMNKDFPPPQFFGIAGDTLREIPKQRHMLSVSSNLCK